MSAGGAVAASVVMVIVSILALAPAAGAAPRVVILAPHRDARVHGKTMLVRVRASSRTGLRANVSGRDVAGRFHRHGSLLEARLRRGRDFFLGENRLAVTVGKGRTAPTATVPFVAVAHAEGLLKVTKLAAHGRRPLRFRIHVSAPVAHLKVSVNGHHYAVGRVAGRRAWTIPVGASDGAHFGRNKIDVAAERHDGKRFDRDRVRFHVGRGAPLAGAGADQTTRTGRAVTLNAGATQAGSHGGSLIYRWKIVSKPAGSHARIARGTSRTARLLPDLPGPYKVQLTAASVSGRTAAEDRARQGAATASSAEAAPRPTCLEALPLQLTPAGGEGGEGGPGGAPGHGEGGAEESVANGSSTSTSEPLPVSSPFLPVTPLESPACVTPIGELTPPPLPLEASRSMSVDQVQVEALPTESPMGWPIETLAADGSTRIGPQVFPAEDGWVRMLVLGSRTLTPVKPFGSWPKGEKVFGPNECNALYQAVKAAGSMSFGEEPIVVLTGMNEAQSDSWNLPEKCLTQVIGLVGAPTPEGSIGEPNQQAGYWTKVAFSGNWSVIGTPHQPGRTFTNLHRVAEQSVEGLPSTLSGSLNGYMQSVTTAGYSFVSPESMPIDTRAEGSSDTVSVFEVGSERVSSETIPAESLALHIAAFNLGEGGGKPAVAANYTDVINSPGGYTDEAGVRSAAEQLQQLRTSETDYLIVMQTVGEEAVQAYTRPAASRYWVDDALVEEEEGIDAWYKQPYLKAKNQSALEVAQNSRWNPNFPTVAGQVGDLAGEVGHDLVANLGIKNASGIYEITRLTMVAENHVESREANYVDGYAAPSPGRLHGTLVRNARGGLRVENGSALSLARSNSFRELAFSPPTPWPLSTGRENEKALEYFAHELWPTEGFKTPREGYVRKATDDWDQQEARLRGTSFTPGKGFEIKTFHQVQAQLEIELNDLAAVRNAIDTWRKVFGEAQIEAFVNAESLGAKLVEQVEHDAKLKPKEEANLDPEAIISNSLYIASSLAGFPEAGEALKLAEVISIVAGGFGLADSVTPTSATEAEGPNANLIRAKATDMGASLFKHLENVSRSLRHFESIFASDWGKLKLAAAYADGQWSYGEEVEKTLDQTMAVNTEGQLYEALMPMAYKEWVVAPRFTRYMQQGFPLPGPYYGYQCLHIHAGGDDTKVYPLKSAPPTALSASVYRPSAEPGSTAHPAQPETVYFTVRSLKSKADPPQIWKEGWGELEDLIRWHHDGSNPPGSLINGLFAPVNPNESPAFPRNLGMSKTAFFAGFDGGPQNWERVICDRNHK